MSVFRVEVLADSDVTPCPMGCGRMTEDPGGGPCHACWDRVYVDRDDEESVCVRCGAHYDGGHRCQECGNGDPLGTGEFDPVTGDEWAG